MRRILVACMLVAVLLAMAACCGGEATGEAAAIEDTVRGYITTYNAGDFAQCLTYFTDYGDEEEALASLSFMRSLSGEIELHEVRDVAITGPQMAIATVVFTIWGGTGTDQIPLKKVQDQWKILWEQETPAPTPTPVPTPSPIPTEGCLPDIDIEVAPELQGVVQLEHCLWFEEDGELWARYRVWNTGNQAIDLCLKLYAYDAEGQELLLEGWCGAAGPGSCLGYCDGGKSGFGTLTATHYKIIVSYWYGD